MRSSLIDPGTVQRRRWWTLAVVCVSLMVITVDATIVNVAVPTFGRELHATTSDLQWIVDIYTLMFAGLLLTAGAIGDRFGRYRTLATGLLIFGAGSLAASLADSTEALIASRAVMGVGGALIMPTSLSVIANVFNDPIERGKAIGVWAGAAALGLGIGPVAGGFLLTHFYRGSIFLVNVPIVLALLAAGWFLVPDSRNTDARKFDPLGAVLVIAGLGSVLWAVIEAPHRGWGSGGILVAVVVGVALLVAFVWWQKRYSSAMLDLQLFRNPRFSVASGAIALAFFSGFGAMFLLQQYLQFVLGYSPLKAGLLLLPNAVVTMVIAPASAGFAQRVGSKFVVGTGLVIVALSLVGYGMLSTTAALWQVIAVTALLGVGFGNVMAPATHAVMSSVPRERAGVGAGMNDTTRFAGAAVGVALLGSVLSSSYRDTVAAAARSEDLPAGLGTAISTDVATALRVAGNTTGSAFQQTINVIARESFVTAFHTAAFIAAAVVAVAAIAVFALLPAERLTGPSNPRHRDRSIAERDQQLGGSS